MIAPALTQRELAERLDASTRTIRRRRHRRGELPAKSRARWRRLTGSTATTMYREMGMRFWLDQGEAEMAEFER